MSSPGESPGQTRTWIPLAVGLQKSWLWSMAARRRVSSRGDTPLTPGLSPHGEACPSQWVRRNPRRVSSPSAAPTREDLCSPWDEGVGSDVEVPSCSALTVRERGSAPVASPMGQRPCPASLLTFITVTKGSRALSKTHSLLEGEARTPTQAVWPQLR